MKVEILRRIAALEQTADRTDRPPLQLLNILALEPVDREEYWSGPEGEVAVLTRIGIPIGGEATGYIHTIQIDIHSESRNRWLETHDLDETDLEAFEQSEILNEQRREKEARDEQERAAMDAIRNSRPRAHRARPRRKSGL